MSNNLAKHILSTIAYYDVMDYPMTGFEIWKYLTRINNSQAEQENEIHDLSAVLDELEEDNLKKYIEEFRGFYFLKGRRKLVSQRIKRNKISERKYKIVLRVTRILRFVPFVRMVAVTGRLAMKNAQEKSDLDLLVVLKQGKIFTGRFLVTLVVHFLGKRRHHNKIADRICLNYFITTKSLEIKLKDIYSSSEYSFILPLFGFKVFRKFQSSNKWIRDYKINYATEELANTKLLNDNYLTKLIRRFGEKLLNFDIIENKLKHWQLKRINKNPKTHQSGSLIIANEETLIFLPKPQGPAIYDEFRKRLAELT